MTQATETLPNGMMVRRDFTLANITRDKTFLLWAEATGARRVRLTERLTALANWHDSDMFLVPDTAATRKALNVMIRRNKLVIVDHGTKNMIWHFCQEGH